MKKSHLNQHRTTNHPFKFSVITSAILLTCSPAFADTPAQLEQINVVEEGDTNTTADSKSYTIQSMKTATGLKIAGKDTPQSVSVITKTQLDDQGLTTIEDTCAPPPG